MLNGPKGFYCNAKLKHDPDRSGGCTCVECTKANNAQLELRTGAPVQVHEAWSLVKLVDEGYAGLYTQDYEGELEEWGLDEPEEEHAEAYADKLIDEEEEEERGFTVIKDQLRDEVTYIPQWALDMQRDINALKRILKRLYPRNGMAIPETDRIRLHNEAHRMICNLEVHDENEGTEREDR